MTRHAILPPLHLHGRVAAVLWADALVPGFQTKAQASLPLAFEGIPGDRHSGFLRAADARTPHYRRGQPIRNIRQISIVSEDELADIAQALGLAEIKPEWLGANLVIAGVKNLSFLPRGTRMAFPDGAALAAEGYNPPCIGPGKVVHGAAGTTPQAFIKAAARRRGIVASVERPGLIKPGDAVELHVPEQWLYAGS